MRIGKLHGKKIYEFLVNKFKKNKNEIDPSLSKPAHQIYNLIVEPR